MKSKNHPEMDDNATEEMYLKSIFHCLKDGRAKSTDIAEYLHISKGSVAEMLKKLEKKGLVKHRPYGKIEFSPNGFRKAGTLLKKYLIIYKFLTQTLGIKPKKAEAESCMLEHTFSAESVKKLSRLMK